MKEIIAPLLAWYKENKRAMPWRDDATPYHVWLSEIMLQQTRIEAAMPYYHAFLQAFPDIASLAEAENGKLMKHWQGLGYYSRVRNLKKAAQIVINEYGGELPRDAAKLRKLAGIGDYTAGAIASIAYGLPEPAVDGNVLRVTMRLQACDDDVLDTKTRKRVAEELRDIYPSGKEAGELTQALMELGETVCIPGAPRCEACPLAVFCKACRESRQNDLPVRLVRTVKKEENRTVLLLSCGGRYAVQRRPKKGLLADLWQFPNESGFLSEADVVRLLSEKGINVVSCRPCGEARHVFTHIIWNMTGFAAEITEEADGYEWKTVAEIERDCAVPTAFRAYLEKIRKST